MESQAAEATMHMRGRLRHKVIGHVAPNGRFEKPTIVRHSHLEITLKKDSIIGYEKI